MDPSFDGSLHSPNEMNIDSEEYIVEPENEKDDLVVITPDELKSVNSVATEPTANDYEAMKEIVLPPLIEQPPIVEDVVDTWHIENWRSLPKKTHGPIFQAGGFPWRILMFPYGNNVEYCSFYLEHGFAEGQVPEDWSCCVQFSLVLWNPNDPTIYAHHTAFHRFTKEEGDWGFTRFEESRKLWTPGWAQPGGRPMVENESANITAYVRVVKDETGVLWHNFLNYDSKKETGFVGLKNQGATCYLNSLIQSLYFTNAFRKAIYQIPTQDEENLQNSAYTLQRLFYQLQTSNMAVGTNELTKSFGWETRHIFEQQDVQELSRKLMERMEEKMKGTEAENVLPGLFCGKVKTYINCINVKYESSRVEDFWDIQLNVSGNRGLEDSFKDYIQVEKLEGDNQYYAGDQYKLQDANKGVIFESFPEVMHLQLKRFEYDIMRDAMTKINDRYEFPEIFDASPYLSEKADKSEPWIYQLHGVLVHSGDLNAGHYYAFLKPTKDGCFYKYDDDKVTRATMREVLEDNFGGEFLPYNGQTRPAHQKPILRHNNAYMLVYIRQSRLDHVLMPVTKEDTPAHLQKRLDEEAAYRDARRREREEQHLYLGVRAITEKTFQAHTGTDLTVWESNPDVNPAAARYYRMRRSATIQDLIEDIVDDLSSALPLNEAIDTDYVRLWCMVNRQNKTVRPDQPITDPSRTIEDAYAKLTPSKQAELRVWVELAEKFTPEGEPIWLGSHGVQNGNVSKNDDILLFLKWFDVDAQTLKGVGHVYIGRDKKVEDLVPLILAKMKWSEKTPSGEKLQLKLWEEIKPQMIEPMKAKQTLKAAELQDGDIVCFQKPVESKPSPKPPSITENLLGGVNPPAKKAAVEPGIKGERIEDAKEFYEYLLYRRVVQLLPHPRASTGGLEASEIEVSIKYSYDQMATKAGEKLGVDPTHLRFHTIQATSGNPKTPVRRGQNQSVQQILFPPYSGFGNSNQRADALYFELLDMPLSEFDSRKNLKVTWITEGITKEETFDILVPKNGTVDDLVNGLIKKAQIDDETNGPIRVYETHNSKVHKELNRDHSVVSITDYVSLVAERIPEEEVNADPSHFIQAFHFQNEPNKPHGIPFRFLIKPEEKFSETKKRLEKRTGIKGKNFDKIKFAVVKRSTYSKPTYLTDDDILWDVATQDDDLLGLDHVDRTRSSRGGAGDLFLK